MTKKDLFRIIFKLFGLYSLISTLIALPTISYMFISYNGGIDWISLFIPLTFLFTTYILLFKPDSIIHLFKLDKGFESDEIDLSSTNSQSLIKTSLIIMSVFLIVSNLGDFISQIIFSFKASISKNNVENLLEVYNPNPVNYNFMLSSGLSLLIGFLLLTNYTRLSKWIDTINKKNSNDC